MQSSEPEPSGKKDPYEWTPQEVPASDALRPQHELVDDPGKHESASKETLMRLEALDVCQATLESSQAELEKMRKMQAAS